jgi:hypothetical protein
MLKTSLLVDMGLNDSEILDALKKHEEGNDQ